MPDEKKIIFFKISWVCLLLGIICDYNLLEKLNAGFFSVNVRTSSIGILLYIVIFIVTFPLKKIPAFLKGKFDRQIIFLLSLLLIMAFISSAAGAWKSFAIGVTLFKYTLLFLCFIITVIYCNLYKQAIRFVFFSFVYFNLFIILSTFADFFIPSFNSLLTGKFGHMPDLVLKINGIIYARPSGFITDTNLTAFTIAFCSLLVLLNADQFKFKYFEYIFYILAGLSFGMLASRSAMVIVLFSAGIFWVFRLASRKQTVIFLLLFFIVQLLTPQTQARLNQYFSPVNYSQKEGIEEGRPIIWKAAMKAFYDHPVVGMGSGVFFKESDRYIKEVLAEQPLTEDQKGLMEMMKKQEINPHSIFLAMMCEYGVIGLLLFLIFIAALFKEYLQKKYFISAVMLVSVLFVSSFSNYAPYYKYYLVICIIGFVLSKNNMKVNDTAESKA